jgi:hypothetical protein
MPTDTPQITTSCYASSTPILGDVQWNAYNPNPQPERTTDIMANTTNRRIVQVFIADPNENVPLEKSVLYTGEQKLTDLNDTELFFEVPIKDLLDAHNVIRLAMVDREASKRAGKDIFLDPVKIRDLRMIVCTIAQF